MIIGLFNEREGVENKGKWKCRNGKFKIILATNCFEHSLQLKFRNCYANRQRRIISLDSDSRIQIVLFSAAFSLELQKKKKHINRRQSQRSCLPAYVSLSLHISLIRGSIRIQFSFLFILFHSLFHLIHKHVLQIIFILLRGQFKSAFSIH